MAVRVDATPSLLKWLRMSLMTGGCIAVANCVSLKGCYHISRMLFKGNFQDASYYDGLLNVENASIMMDSVNVDSSMHRVEYSSVK